MFSVEHASSTGPALMEEGGGGGSNRLPSCLVAKQAVEFPQVLTRSLYSLFSESSFLATLWLIEVDLRKWDKRG